MEDNSFEEGENYAAAAAKYRARRAAATGQQQVQVTVQGLPVQQPLQFRLEEPVVLQKMVTRVDQLPANQRVQIRVEDPVRLQRIPPVVIPSAVPRPPIPRRELHRRERAVVSSLVIPPPDAFGRPTRYVYVPGLAQEALVLTPCLDVQGFLTRISNVFGWRTKRVFEGRDSINEHQPDQFMTGALIALCEARGAIPLNCGRALRWVPVRGSAANTKAFQLLGMPQQNLLAVNAGDKPKAPKTLQYGNSQWHLCLAAEYIGHLKGKVIPPNGQDGGQLNEQRTLSRLQANDVLCIVGHGNALGATLTYKIAPPGSHKVKDNAIKKYQPGFCETDDHLEKWHVDANTLAALLVDEGLPITHQNIEMVMCFGAGLSLANEQTVQPFCRRLAGALSGFGYKQIKVRGALGLMSGSDLSVNASLTPNGKYLRIDPSRNVTPDQPEHANLFVTFTGDSEANMVESKLSTTM
jgi:hypothetical protein